MSNSKDNNSHNKVLPQYTINEFRLKILLQARNYLYKILCSLINKLGSFWMRKIKWLYQFITERIQIYGLQQMGLNQIQQAQLYIEKLNQLKLIIRLARTYLQKFGTGFFPQIKIKDILFTHQYSFYKMIEALLYNQYEFRWQSDSTRIVNYQKNKKITEQVKNKHNIVKTVNVNSKSLNINPHYDLVFQKVTQQMTAKYGSSYQQLKGLINQALRFIHAYYKNSQSYFYGGQLITMIQNCKNTEFLKPQTIFIMNQIKKVLYPKRGMVRTGLQLFCQQVFINYISKKKDQQSNQQSKVNKFRIVPTDHLSILPNKNVNKDNLNPQNSFQQNSLNKNKNVIKKTRSQDMVIQGWNQEQKQMVPALNLKNGQQSQIFYSIKQNNENQSVNKPSQMNNQQLRFDSIKQNNNAMQKEQDQVLMPQF